jgi:hypothetical protein
VAYVPVIASLSITQDTIAGGKEITIHVAAANPAGASNFRFGATSAVCVPQGSGTAVAFLCTVPAGRVGPTWVSFTSAAGVPSRFTAASTFLYTDLD